MLSLHKAYIVVSIQLQHSKYARRAQKKMSNKVHLNKWFFKNSPWILFSEWIKFINCYKLFLCSAWASTILVWGTLRQFHIKTYLIDIDKPFLKNIDACIKYQSWSPDIENKNVWLFFNHHQSKYSTPLELIIKLSTRWHDSMICGDTVDNIRC